MRPSITLIFLVLCPENIFGLIPQYFMVYPDNPIGCRGHNYEYSLESKNRIGEVGKLFNYKTRGGWIIKEESGLNIISVEDGSLCSMDISGNVSFTKLVNTDLEEPGITIMSPSWDNYTTFFQSSAQELSLPQPIQGADIAFNGIRNYTLFSGSNYTGNSTCIVPRLLVQINGYGCTLFLNEITHQIGSFRIGCNATTNVNIRQGTIMELTSESNRNALRQQHEERKCKGKENTCETLVNFDESDLVL